jgi:hypothetical protein
MPDTYVSDLVRCVFSTKERRKLIRAETQPKLWSFIGGIARKYGFKTLIIGGTETTCTFCCLCPRRSRRPRRCNG